MKKIFLPVSLFSLINSAIYFITEYVLPKPVGISRSNNPFSLSLSIKDFIQLYIHSSSVLYPLFQNNVCSYYTIKSRSIQAPKHNFHVIFYNCIIFSPLYQNSTIILHILYLFFSMIMYHVFQLLSKSTIYFILIII